MQISLLLALQILKLFAIMLMGYAIVKLGLLKASDSKALSVVLVYLIMPCVIINAFQVEATPEVQKGLALACMILASMAIAETPLKRIVLTRHNYVTVVLRLMVYPLLTLLLMKPFLDLAQIPHADAILLTVFLPSITPACATITSMAQLYDRDAAYASSLYVLTTLLSIFTMPCMVFLYETLV